MSFISIIPAVLRLVFVGSLFLSGCIHMAAEISTNRYRALPQTAQSATLSVKQQDGAWCANRECKADLEKPVNVLFDPHAHLVMKPGMTYLFSGDPEHLEHQPLWSDPLSEKMAIERLRKSGLGLVVVCLYANVMFVWPGDVPAAIYEEIRLAKELAARHPDFLEFATTSRQAREIIASGKIALVFALEGAEWAMRDEKAVADLYAAGVRMVNPVHLYDSWIGGSDMQEGGKLLLNPPGLARAKRVKGSIENPRGLAREGKKLLHSLVQYGYVLDVSHMSRQSLRDTDMLFGAQVPLLNSHMPNLISTSPSERAVGPETMRILGKHGGLLGLVPASYSPGIPMDPDHLCQGSVETFARIYADAVRMAGDVPIAFSSDFNGGVSHLRPTHGPDGCYPLAEAKSDFDRNGLADAGYVPDMLDAMRARGVDVSPMYQSSERFLKIWSRAEGLKSR